MQICPGCTFGNNGRARVPERFVKSDGIQTLVRKLRLVHSLPGRSLTRFDFFAAACCAWRTIFRFLEKGFGTVEGRYKRVAANQTLTPCRELAVGSAVSNTKSATAGAGNRGSHNAFADLGADHVPRPNFGSVERVDRRQRRRSGNCARRIFAEANSAGNRE